MILLHESFIVGRTFVNLLDETIPPMMSSLNIQFSQHYDLELTECCVAFYPYSHKGTIHHEDV